MSASPYVIGIVGLGPRGSYALECLVSSLGDVHRPSMVRLVLFDDAVHIGAGHVYDLAQPDSNWINISERALELTGRRELSFAGARVPPFPSYHEWAEVPQDDWPDDLPDTFPPRAQVGRYLHARAQTLVDPLVEAGVATLINGQVRHLIQVDEQWSVRTAQGQTWLADEVLLTVGHQPTSPDEQIVAWQTSVGSSSELSLHTAPYPIGPITSRTKAQAQAQAQAQRQAQARDRNLTVAIRGYGLAMMDVVRGMALAFGEFDGAGGELSYRQTLDGHLQLVPFSLDGLPMGPKPLTPNVDALFAPTDRELAQLDETLRNREAQTSAAGAELLIGAMVPIAARVFSELPHRHPSAPTGIVDLESLISTWLADSDTDHPSLDDRSATPERALDQLVDMAVGSSAVSVSYCVGQVWRHCHPTIYSSLSDNHLNDDALAATIALDERVKRYSFGPPVESIRQLSALVKAGVVNLDFVEDPDIVCDERGWTLSSAGKDVTAATMVDSVLDGPQLEKVSAPLITELLSESVLQPVHDDLGIATDEDATVRSTQADASPPLAVLGRLAKGTVIGVDAILECFGERPQRWADGARRRLVERHDAADSNTS